MKAEIHITLVLEAKREMAKGKFVDEADAEREALRELLKERFEEHPSLKIYSSGMSTCAMRL